MPRLPNRGTTQRAPQTGASVPELPDFSPQLAEIPGGQETNAALQRWWDIVRQRIEFNNGSVDKRMQEYTRTIDGITGSITVLQEITSNVEDYLEARYTINVAAGAVVTGMTIFSATGPDTEVSEVAFQADRFKINTSTGGNKQIFSATASAVKLGDVLTVDLANAKMFIGVGDYADPNTAFYVDEDGFFSLKDKLYWNALTDVLTIEGTIIAEDGIIGGWTIGPTTLTGGNAILNSAGLLVLGTSNDIVYISAADPTYRIWVGNVTAGSATFRVSKTGVLTATGGVFSGTITSTTGTIGGFTLGATSLVLGTGADMVSVGQFPTAYFRIGVNTGAGSELDGGQLLFRNADGTTSVSLGPVGGSTGTLRLFGSTGTERIRLQDATLLFDSDTNLYRSSANVLKTDDAFEALSISGTGSGITTLNASNISSGTIANARLPAAISVSTLDLSSTLNVSGLATFSGDVLINGADKLYFYNTTNGTYITEDFGLQLWGDGTHPVQIKGGALLQFGTYSALGAETLSGFVTFKSDDGTTRKLAVVA